MLRHVLERDGRFALAEAADADEALEVVGSNPPDAILLDISMPGRSGIAILRRLRTISPQTRIVVLSSHSEMSDEIVSMGADAFLPKLTPPRELVRAVAQLMGF